MKPEDLGLDADDLTEEELAEPLEPDLTLEADEATESIGPPVQLAQEEHLPPALTEPEWWVIADPADKQPRAPWDNGGSSHKVKWNRNLDPEERPETTYEEARKWSDFPDYENLHTSVILPPEHADLTLIDLDDVIREGELTEPAVEIVRAAGTYAEVSQSFDGESGGVHLFVEGHLPEHIGKVVEYFDSDRAHLGQLELYDHGRVVVTTGRHLAGTPRTVASGQPVIDRLLRKYLPLKRLLKRSRTSSEIEKARKEARRSAGRSGGGSTSSYWSTDILDVAEPGYAKRSGVRVQGCHPGHGATAPDHADSDSTNFAVFTDKEYWRCFAHGSWGGALDLVAVLEGVASCEDMPGFFDRCSDEEFLEVCLKARDVHGFEGDPPYRALVAVARRYGLSMADKSSGILGRDCWKIARGLYDGL